MTHNEILAAMGSMASDAEAQAMGEMLAGLGIDSLDDISDAEFFALIPLAVAMVREVGA